MHNRYAIGLTDCCKTTLLLVYFLLGLSFSSFGQAKDCIANDVYPPGIGLLDTDGFSSTAQYMPSGSFWELNFSEQTVYQRKLSYQNAANPDNNFDLRIGKGGQIYSFIGPFGESIPPQYRNPNNPALATYGGGDDFAPWVDEVWQSNAKGFGPQHNPPTYNSCHHQAGVYLRTPSQTEPFFSPIVAECYDEEKQCYTITNWGQLAHTNGIFPGLRSGILYQTKYTIIGDGIIQVDQLIYNFGKETIEWINVPWGGVRDSSLDHFFRSNPDNSCTLDNRSFGASGVTPLATTGGYAAWSSDLDGNSPALGIVFGLDQNNSTGITRSGFAGGATTPNTRNFNVFTHIRRPTFEFCFGKGMLFRYFYVVDGTKGEVQSTILSQNLVDKTHELVYCEPKSNQTVCRYQFKEDQTGVSTILNPATNNSLDVRATPYENSYPIFLVKSSSGDYQITTNLYHFTEQPWDGTNGDIKLLGYVDRPTNVEVITETVCEGDSYTFADGTSIAHVLEDTSQLSQITGIATTCNPKTNAIEPYDSLVMYCINVIPKEVPISIANPCNCTNPNKVILPDGSTLFEETLVVDASQFTNPSVSLAAADNNFLDAAGNPFLASTVNFIPQGAGIYTAVFYALINAPASITVEVNGVQKLFQTSTCLPCPFSTISVANPCNCINPNKVILPDGSTLFEETLVVDASLFSNPSVSLAAADNNFLDAAGNPLLASTVNFIPQGAGIYTAVFYALINAPASITVEVNGVQQPFQTSTCLPCPFSTISVADPCNCTNPNNIILSDGSTLFADQLLVDASQFTNPTVTIAAADNNFLNVAGNPFSASAVNFTNEGGGIFSTSFYTLANRPATITVDVNGTQQAFQTSSCSPCLTMEPTPVPTMSQWGLLIIGLLLLNIGVLFIYANREVCYF